MREVYSERESTICHDFVLTLLHTSGVGGGYGSKTTFLYLSIKQQFKQCFIINKGAATYLTN